MGATRPGRIGAVLLLGLFVALLHLGGMARENWGLLDGRLGDPDGYMRLARVAQLHADGRWYDARSPRSNAPYGETLHWTRPFDAVLLAGGLALAPVLGFADGLVLWVAASGPIMHLGAIVLLLWGTGGLLDRHGRAALALMALFQAPITATFLASRPDHHGLQALVFAGLVACGLRLLEAPARRGPALAAGLLAALAVWISVEGLLAAALLMAMLALAWLAHGDDFLDAGIGFALAAAGGSTLALLLERPAADWAAVEYDRLSIVHLALFGLHAALWLVLLLARRRLVTRRARGLALLCGGALALALISVAFPKLAGGPLVDVPERVRTVWLTNIAEVVSIWSTPDAREQLYLLLLYLGPCTAALPYMAWLAARERGTVRWRWCLLLLIAAVFFALALYQLRWSVYAAIAALPGFGKLALEALQALGLDFAAGRRPIGRVLALSLGRLALLALFGLGFAGAAWAVKPAADPVKAAGLVRACDLTRLARALADPAGLGQRPRRILSFIFDGPELLYRTPHQVVATPYHRNGEGILDTFDFFTATEPATARGIVERRGVDWILLCPTASERLLYDGAGEATLFRRLAQGEAPPWLIEVALPAAAGGQYRLYEVRR